MKDKAFLLAGVDEPDWVKEHNVQRYTVSFKTMKEAKKAAKEMARDKKKPVYLSHSNGRVVLVEERMFASAGYYVIQPDGTFYWDEGAV
jgi:hypothetical protein